MNKKNREVKTEVVTARKKFQEEYSNEGRDRLPTWEEAYARLDKAATDWLLEITQRIPGEVISVINLQSSAELTEHWGQFRYRMSIHWHLAVFFKRRRSETKKN